MNKNLVKPYLSILDVMKVINDSVYRIALIADENNLLIGTLTDGDIRRGLLSGADLNDSVSSVMNSSPISVSQGTPDKVIYDIMVEKGVLQIPVLDECNKIVSIELRDTLSKRLYHAPEEHSDIWVVLMLGGLGKRLHPLTENTPKPMLSVGDKPLLEIIINNFIKQGFKKFIFSVNYKADVIHDYFGDGSKYGIEISYIYEKKKMGTAGALSLLDVKPPGPFLVMNGDLLTTISFIDLVDFHCQNNVLATMCVREYTHEIPYGIVKNTGVELETIIEKPSETYFINAGIYVLAPEVLGFIPEDEALDMPKLFDKISTNGGNSVVFPVHEYWLDIGSFEDLERARQEYTKIF